MNIEYCEAKSNDAKEIINYLNIVTGQTDNLNYGNNEINLNTIQEMEFIQEMHENDHSVMILAKDGDKIVGIATLKGHKQSRLKHRADLGVSVLKEYWHQGIMSESATIFMEMLKQEGVSFITATHDVVNINSGKVMQKIGMTYQYSYTERWMPKDKDVTFRMYQFNFKEPQDWVYLEYWNKYPHFVEEL